MTRKTEMVVLACGMALFWGSFAQAGTPQIVGTRPFGVQRGVSSEVTIGGSNLGGNPRLIGPFASRIEPVDPKRRSDLAWTFKLTVLPDVAVGVYPVRVQTDDGLSNPFLFAVGQLPQFSEKEDNTSFEAPRRCPRLRWWSRARQQATLSITSGLPARRDRSWSSMPSVPGLARGWTPPYD